MGRRGLMLAVALVLLAGCAQPNVVPTESVADPSPVSTPLATVSSTPPVNPSPSTASEASSATVPTCDAMAAAMPPGARIGQLFMLGLSSKVSPATAAKTVRSTKVGSVVLLGTSYAGATATAAISAAIRAAAPGTIVSVDQEGGYVQRLQGPGFERIPTAMTQSTLSPATLTVRATTWGRELRAAGVVYDLAPVAGVVPAASAQSNAPIGALRRGYGYEPTQAAASVAAFVAGMRAAGVATSIKHFPGLGYVTGNTDFTRTTDTVTVRGSVPGTFRAGIAAGADSVMVSSAVYSKIDSGVPGVFSSVIITGMLRGDLAFTGVVISDDLGSAKAVASVRPGDRAVRFLVAGGDLVVNADPAVQSAMTAAVTQRVRTDPAFAARVAHSAARILRLKASVGAVDCR